MSRLLGRFGRWTPFLASWSLSVSLAAASSAATPDPRPLAEIRWQKNSPAIPLDSCVAVPAPVGPEDVLAIPGRKAVLVSSARRNLWNFKKNYGGIFRLGLEPLEAANLPRRYSPDFSPAPRSP